MKASTFERLRPTNLLIDQSIEGDRRSHQRLVALHQPPVPLQPPGGIPSGHPRPSSADQIIAVQQFKVFRMAQEGKHQFVNALATIGHASAAVRATVWASWPAAERKSLERQEARVHVIGTDASGVACLSAAAQRLLGSADLVAVPRRLLEGTRAWLLSHEGEGPTLAPPVDLPELRETDDPTTLLPLLQRALAAERCVVVLASGDPLWFGIGRVLLQHLPAEQLRFHPAPTSLQLAFARIGRPWQDAEWISLHGRDPEALVAKLQKRPPALAVLTDPGRGGAETVRRVLLASGLAAAYAFWLCERLGAPQERVVRVEPGDSLPAAPDPLNLVLLVAEPPVFPKPGDLPLFGLDDGLWLQHSDRPGLMTKREVRIQLLADLDLPGSGVLWDIGAGVGSVGLEAIRLRPDLQLWAVERRSGAAALIAANAERLGVTPAGVVEGRAPEALARLPDPHRVLLGGGGPERTAVLQAVLQRLRPGGVVVIPLATLEALGELRAVLEAEGLRVRVGQYQAWRGAPLGEGTRLAPLNPVLVLQGRRS
jgi:precorrin-6Y C5,15-methyltransferase (decarboxylating)